MTATVGIAVVVIVLLIAFAVYAGTRRRPVAPIPQPRRRAFELEEHVGDLLTGPTHRYGKIFTKYEVWKDDNETRLELVAGPPWKRLNSVRPVPGGALSLASPRADRGLGGRDRRRTGANVERRRGHEIPR